MDTQKEEKITLYKYKSLKQFEYFLDIITQNKLYGATFKELNDPMEGYFQSNNFAQNDWNKIKDAKNKVRICSLSKNHDKALMWTHYADEHRGCCIELEVTGRSWNKIDVQYVSKPVILDSGIDKDKAIELIVRQKSDFWKYEDEVRFVKTDLKISTRNIPNMAYLPIKIKKIYLGVRVNIQQQARIERIIKKVNSNISVEKMKRTDINFWSK